MLAHKVVPASPPSEDEDGFLLPLLRLPFCFDLGLPFPPPAFFLAASSLRRLKSANESVLSMSLRSSVSILRRAAAASTGSLRRWNRPSDRLLVGVVTVRTSVTAILVGDRFDVISDVFGDVLGSLPGLGDVFVGDFAAAAVREGGGVCLFDTSHLRRERRA